MPYYLRLKRYLLVFVCVFLFTLPTFSQYYVSDADPASTNWFQIKTDNFQIIFPEGYKYKASEFASKLDYAYDYVQYTMKGKPRKLSIIIHTQSAMSNGMVAWVPRRMELWTVPSQDAFNYSQEWMEQLIVHEMRHFVQENKMNQGFTKVLKVLMGEQAEMIPLGMMTRQWFMEGDAVVTETALSKSGRGRMPSFEQGLRALTLEQGKQSYDVAHLGTYNYYVPNHYELGYHTVAANRLLHDKYVFDRKLDDIGRFATLRGLRDSRKKQYYGDAIDYLDELWRKQDSTLVLTSYSDVLEEEDDYASYEFLQEDDGKLYAMRSSLSSIPEVVEIDSVGNYSVVMPHGWSAEYNFSVSQGKIVYVDELPDLRWGQRSFADVFIYDISTKTRKRLTRGQVYQAPSLSHDGRTIAVQHVDGNGEYEIHLLDASHGKVIGVLGNPMNQFYFSPVWSEDDKKIAYLAQEKYTKMLKCFDLDTKREKVLTEGSYGELSHPVWQGDTIYFTASYSGINNIYVCDVATKAISQVTSARFGAAYAVTLGEDIVFANYTSSGYKPVLHGELGNSRIPLSQVEDMGLGLADSLTAQDAGVIDFSQATDKHYEIKKYSRFTHLFHVHSWYPLVTSDEDVDEVTGEITSDLYPSLTLLSQNKLSTSVLTATFDANPVNSDEKFNVSYEYSGFYPKLGLDIAWGYFDRGYYTSVSPTTGYDEMVVMHKINDFIVRPSVSIPLSFKKGVYSLYLSNQLFGEYVRLSIPEKDYSESYLSRGFSSFFSRAKQSSSRDLYSPSLQQLFFLMSYEDLYADSYKLASYGRVNFPGIGAHHVLKLGLNWQKKDYYSSNVLKSLPRGYTSSVNTGVTYASADYFLPLSYPDAHLGGVFNLKRMAMSLYGDIARVSELDFDDNALEQSLIGGGASLFFDVNFLRYEVDVRLGIQAGVAAYSGNEKLTFPVNLIFEYNIF